MQSLMSWMEHSALHDLLVDSVWAIPASEIVHFLGLILIFGSAGIVDLRLLGVSPAIPINAILRFLPVAAAGFALNLFSGTLFLFSDPHRYFPNTAFQLKLVAIVLAGLNVAWFACLVRPRLAERNTIGADAKIVAVLSLLLWTVVIVLGRTIPYLE